MKKYRFWCNGGTTVDTFWFDNDVSEKEIEADFKKWVDNNEDVGFEELI